MPRSWRQHGSTIYHYGRRVFPFLVSAGLVTWLVWRITPEKLYQAFSASEWPWLVFATVVQLLVLATWDTFSLWWLFSQPDRALPFPVVLRARGDSLLWSAINLEIGQGVFAWKLADYLGCPILAALGRCFALSLFDAGTLFSLGIIGSFLWPMPIVHILRWVCVAIVLGLLTLALVIKFLPQRGKDWLEQKPWAKWIQWWTWRHSLLLILQRLIMFLLVFLYASICLMICGIHVNARVVFGAIPFVLIAESLPGTGGLGERETALVYLLSASDEQQPVLLSFGLIWSAVIILGRLSIGLASSWLPRTALTREAGQRQAATCE
jgi:hypothetical protein